MIRLLQQTRQPFNVNAIAQAAAIGALSDAEWVSKCQSGTGMAWLNWEMDFSSWESNTSPARQILFSLNPEMAGPCFPASKAGNYYPGTWSILGRLSSYISRNRGRKHTLLICSGENQIDACSEIMISTASISFDPLFLLITWIGSLIVGLYLGVFRSLIDRIRAGFSTLPADESKSAKLLESFLINPVMPVLFSPSLPFFQLCKLYLHFSTFSFFLEALPLFLMYASLFWLPFV